MFIMTASITVNGLLNGVQTRYKPFRPHSVNWKKSIDGYSDSSLIKIPAMASLSGSKFLYQFVETGLQFQEGMNVQVDAGYDGNNITRFKGFIRRINYTIPVEIECEGYSYQLRQKLNISKSYASGVKLKTILNDLIAGTDITLSPKIPDIAIQSPVVFKMASGTQILDWLKEKTLMTIYFNNEELYVGLRETNLKGAAKFRLGWNVVKDNDLKFNSNMEHSDVKIQMQQREKTGQFTKEVYESKFTSTKVKRIQVRLDPAFLQQIAQDYKSKLVTKGYEGLITAFAVPYVEPGMTAALTDDRYPQRNGEYFIEAVDGEFGPQGGRQRIKLGNILSNG